LNFKLDENLDPRLVSMFEQAGHTADTVLAERLSGAEDEAVYQICCREARCLVTLDLDFANPLRFAPEPASGMIVLRPKRPTFSAIRQAVASLLPVLDQRPVQGRLWIVEPGRIREYEP
jgi:predicted nuclease of predicted toxin-antitoxin system